MKRLGISVYPERAPKEQCYEYMRLAGKYGFRRVFTCLLSVEESKEKIIDDFTEFCRVAHESGLTVSVDTNPDIFTKLNATPMDLSVFAQMGVDIVRLDGHFGEFEDIEITKNHDGIMIEYNASSTIGLDLMIEKGADRSNMCICSNFYPQKNTGMGLARYRELNSRYQPLGLNNATFVTSQEPHTHGPWEVYDGLPTLEIHRSLPIDLQLRHLNALGLCNDFMIGNAFASEKELRAMAETDLHKLTLKVDPEEQVSEIEREIITCEYHASRDDCNELVVRSSFPRVKYKHESIVPRGNGKVNFTKGDVIIVNDNLKHYAGELMIVLDQIRADDCYNYVGRINEGEQLILDCIRPANSFALKIRQAGE
ncbi:MupG family TIM beta-alpha barrel fold protein [Lachnospiraceae bacterium JLR.KK008]